MGEEYGNPYRYGFFCRSAAIVDELKYKQDIKNPELIAAELKRCADELAACDVSMQTIRDLIRS